MEPDLAVLIKSDAIEIEDKILLVMYYYHQEHSTGPDGKKSGLKDRTFYRCACRLDYKDAWNDLADSMIFEDPADSFTLDQAGLPDRMRLKGDYVWTRSNARRWFRMKTSGNKVHSIEQFLNGRFTTTGKNKGKRLPGAFETDLPYIGEYVFEGMTYELRSPYDFPVGKWLVSTRIAPPRKKPRIIT